MGKPETLKAGDFTEKGKDNTPIPAQGTAHLALQRNADFQAMTGLAVQGEIRLAAAAFAEAGELQARELRICGWVMEAFEAQLQGQEHALIREKIDLPTFLATGALSEKILGRASASTRKAMREMNKAAKHKNKAKSLSQRAAELEAAGDVRYVRP